jgi:hypothetical protein
MQFHTLPSPLGDDHTEHGTKTQRDARNAAFTYAHPAIRRRRFVGYSRECNAPLPVRHRIVKTDCLATSEERRLSTKEIESGHAVNEEGKVRKNRDASSRESGAAKA